MRTRISFGKGPFRTTISRSGITVSAGANGMRTSISTAGKKSKRSTTSDSKVNPKTSLKFLQVSLKIVSIPMVILGLLLTFVNSYLGIGSICIGIFEWLFSNYLKRKVGK